MVITKTCNFERTVRYPNHTFGYLIEKDGGEGMVKDKSQTVNNLHVK